MAKLIARIGLAMSINLNNIDMVKYKRQGIIHIIAHCQNCDWQEEDFKKAMSKARKHATETGHKINIETGVWGTFN